MIDLPVLFSADTAMDAALAPARVWIVEDDEGYRRMLAYLLDHTSGVRCARVFGDAETALARLEAASSEVVDDAASEAAQPDVVLLDVNLPGLSGIASLGRIKTLAPTVPVVMLTIRDDAQTIFQAFCAGASGYLLKNSTIDQIVLAIREALGGGMLMPAPVARQVLAFFSRELGEPPDYGLTEREKEVLQKMVEGYTQKEIAAALFVIPYTVNGHIQRIYGKLHVKNGNAAVAKALREGLL